MYISDSSDKLLTGSPSNLVSYLLNTYSLTKLSNLFQRVSSVVSIMYAKHVHTVRLQDFRSFTVFFDSLSKVLLLTLALRIKNNWYLWRQFAGKCV